MNKEKNKQFNIKRRKARIHVKGTAERPRLAIFRSLKTIYAQLIDDSVGNTLVSAGAKDVKGKKNKIDAAKEIGIALAQKAKEKGITKVVFDRASYKYHGRVQSLADGAREGGLQF